MNTNMRERFLWWLFIEAGGHEGERWPWWAMALRFVLIPSTIIQAYAWRFYDPSTACITYNGVKISLCLLNNMTRHTADGYWFRVVKRDGDMVTLETKRFD